MLKTGMLAHTPHNIILPPGPLPRPLKLLQVRRERKSYPMGLSTGLGTSYEPEMYALFILASPVQSMGFGTCKALTVRMIE